MPVFLLGFAKSFLGGLTLKNALILGTIISLGFLGVRFFNFVDEAIDNREMLVRQELTIELKEKEIENLQIVIDQAEEAQRISEAARVEAERVASELRSIRDAAIASGDENNGTIAPVLGDTLRALRDRVR